MSILPPIKVSETFYSIQGEGPSAGVPSLFLRLSGCNLTCGGLNTCKTGELDNGATWRCDTIEVWLKGEDTSPHDLILDWENKGWLHALKEGAHLVVTGGEPLLQEEALVSFFQTLEILIKKKPFIECETNGTIRPDTDFDYFISQYNVSPKLKNSGMPKERRIDPRAINFFNRSDKATFKFVLSSRDEYDQLLDDFLLPFSIKKSKIMIMPAASSRQEFILNSLPMLELCKRENIRFSPRYQLLFWDKSTGI
jgi:7-carboxy-7-deazaguanine synthase